jgi:hypothetical protein
MAGQRGFVALNVCHEDEHVDTVLQAFGDVFSNVSNWTEKRVHQSTTNCLEGASMSLKRMAGSACYDKEQRYLYEHRLRDGFLKGGEFSIAGTRCIRHPRALQ